MLVPTVSVMQPSKIASTKLSVEQLHLQCQCPCDTNWHWSPRELFATLREDGGTLLLAGALKVLSEEPHLRLVLHMIYAGATCQ